MSNLGVIFKRELGSYFATPLAYIFIVIFLVLSALFTFDLGGFSSHSIPGYTCFWCQRLPCGYGPRSASRELSNC